MKRIAIKGDKENGHKIIQYFKSLGAINKFDYYGALEDFYYFVDWDFYYYNIIDARNIIPGGYEVFESWNEFEKNYLNKNKMEERNIKISLEKAKQWYKQGGDLREVAIQAFSEDELQDKFPSSWDEYNRVSIFKGNRVDAGTIFGSAEYCHFATKEEADAFIALGKLIQLRDEYWRLDNNWEPDWKSMDVKYCISRNGCKTTVCDHKRDYGAILAFRTTELRDKFNKDFRGLIDQAKMFL